MTVYLWKQNAFFNDFREEIINVHPYLINISSAYISYKGAQLLKDIIKKTKLKVIYKFIAVLNLTKNNLLKL